MPYDWYVIYNKVTGKKRPGGLMHYGKALTMMWELLRQARSAWQIMERGEYEATRAAQKGRGAR